MPILQNPACRAKKLGDGHAAAAVHALLLAVDVLSNWLLVLDMQGQYAGSANQQSTMQCWIRLQFWRTHRPCGWLRLLYSCAHAATPVSKHICTCALTHQQSCAYCNTHHEPYQALPHQFGPYSAVCMLAKVSCQNSRARPAVLLRTTTGSNRAAAQYDQTISNQPVVVSCTASQHCMVVCWHGLCLGTSCICSAVLTHGAGEIPDSGCWFVEEHAEPHQVVSVVGATMLEVDQARAHVEAGSVVIAWGGCQG